MSRHLWHAVERAPVHCLPYFYGYRLLSADFLSYVCNGEARVPPRASALHLSLKDGGASVCGLAASSLA